MSLMPLSSKYWDRRRHERSKIAEQGSYRSIWERSPDRYKMIDSDEYSTGDERGKLQVDRVVSSDESSLESEDSVKRKERKKEKKRLKKEKKLEKKERRREERKRRKYESDSDSDEYHRRGRSYDRKRLIKDERKSSKDKRRRRDRSYNSSSESDHHQKNDRRKSRKHRSERRRRSRSSSDREHARRNLQAERAAAQIDEDEPGPLPKSTLLDAKPSEFGKQLLPGEGQAMAAFVAEGKRIPRRGEVGYTSEQITKFEDSGYVMSGSRHRRMEAVRIRKENQIYSADEKRALANFNKEEAQKRENTILQQFRDLVKRKTKKD